MAFSSTKKKAVLWALVRATADRCLKAKAKMGQKKSVLTKEELEEITELTYLKKSDVLKAYDIFEKLDQSNKDGKTRSTARIPCERVRESVQELRLNPFGDRICHVFNTGGKAGMSFEDFIDMYSAMNEAASRHVKTTFAFKIYDFDGDGVIGKDDIRQAIDRLVFDEDKHLTKAETNCIIEHVLAECDNDEDGALCYPEFQQALGRCPDFELNFKMYL